MVCLRDLLDRLIFLACVLHNKGVNGQTVAKTALHTSDKCDMYAHVSPYDKTGEWEWISKFKCFSCLRALGLLSPTAKY